MAYDGPPGYTAVRVKSLEEECRELNRRYILPIGYGANNMFLTDWKEENFGELDFYDLFQLLYPFCLLYTSDAADDLLCVDLGGRLNIKKKNNS